MKKLFIKAIVFAVLFVVVDCVIGHLFKTLQDKAIEYPIDYGNDYLKAVYNVNEDVVIIGESRAHDNFIPSVMADSLNMTVINAAHDGSSILQHAAVIRMMLDRYVPKILIWEVCPMDLMGKWHDEDMDGLVNLNPFYDTDSLSKSLIKQRGTFEYIKMLSQAYRNNNKLLGLLFVIQKGQYEDHLKGYNQLPKEGYKYPSKRETTYEDDLAQEKLGLLKETLLFIKGKGCRIALVSSPQYEHSNLDETIQAKAFQTLVDSIGVPYINHRYIENMQCDSSYYKDSFHLNEKGARIYMQFFIPILKQNIN